MNMKWKEVTLEEAMKAPAHVQATFHYHEDRKAWLIPDEENKPQEGEERMFTLKEALQIADDFYYCGTVREKESKNQYFLNQFGINLEK